MHGFVKARKMCYVENITLNQTFNFSIYFSFQRSNIWGGWCFRARIVQDLLLLSQYVDITPGNTCAS